MAPFEAHCSDCAGDVTVDTRFLRVLTPADPGRAARAVFTCPTCGARASVPVEAMVVAALQDAGVPVVHGHPSLGPPAERPGGPPIGYDDLLDFHLLLQRPDWHDQLVAASARALLAG